MNKNIKLEHYNNNNPMSNPQLVDMMCIMRNSFPLNERRDEEKQIKLLKKDDINLITVENLEGVVLGFASFLLTSEFCFVEHLAIDSRCRGLGYGKMIVEELLKSVSEDVAVFLEIEPCVDEITARRRTFYERLGFIENSLVHYQKPHRDSDAPLRLNIMSYKRAINECDYVRYISIVNEVMYNFSNFF